MAQYVTKEDATAFLGKPVSVGRQSGDTSVAGLGDVAFVSHGPMGMTTLQVLKGTTSLLLHTRKKTTEAEMNGLASKALSRM